MSKRVKVDIPIMSKPGEVNQNGYVYSKGVLEKAFDEATDPILLSLPDDGRITANNLCLDERLAIGEVTSIDLDKGVIHCEAFSKKRAETIKAYIELGYVAGYRGVGRINTVGSNVFELADDFRLVGYALLPRPSAQTDTKEGD